MKKSTAAWDAWHRLGSPRYIVAPMVDGSELAFRDLCRTYGANLAYTPMLNAKVFARDSKYRKENFSTNANDRPLAAQFCSNDPATLVEAARYIQDDVDAIDINLGCPQGIARRGHYGAFLMDDLDLVSRIVSTAVKELKVPVWCKIRVFPDNSRTVAYAKMLEAAGASLIAVHGRTRDQKGKGCAPADWNLIRDVRCAVDVPVVANGNVRCLEDAKAALKFTGAEGVMSAWALLDNPSTFSEVGGISRMQLARQYLDLAEKYGTPMRMVRLHIFKMFRGRLDANMDLNEEVAKCRSIEAFRKVADVLSERCDFDNVSFEERVARGDAIVNVVSEKKAKRLKRDLEKAELEGKKKLKKKVNDGTSIEKLASPQSNNVKSCSQ